MTVWKDYREKKAAGLITIEKITTKEYPFDSKTKTKEFNVNDGSFIDWRTKEFNKDILAIQKNQLLEGIKDIDALTADLGKIII